MRQRTAQTFLKNLLILRRSHRRLYRRGGSAGAAGTDSIRGSDRPAGSVWPGGESGESGVSAAFSVVGIDERACPGSTTGST